MQLLHQSLDAITRCILFSNKVVVYKHQLTLKKGAFYVCDHHSGSSRYSVHYLVFDFNIVRLA